MASASAKRNTSAIQIRRAPPMISKAKFEDLRSRSIAAAKRLKDASAEDTDAMVGIGSGLALALYEKGGRSLPTVMGLDPAVVWGFGAWALTRGRKGKGASMGRAAGLALATIGVNRSAMRGSIKVGEDDDSPDDSYDDSDL